MSTQLSGNRLSFSLNGLQVGLEASPGQTLRVCYGQEGGRHILRVLSFSDSTLAAGRELFSISSGDGWTLGARCFTAASQEPPTAKPSDDRPSNSDAAYLHTLKGGAQQTLRNMSSTTKGGRLENYGDPGQLRADWLGCELPRTTCDGHGPQSLCRED